jgi:hypothetical protein
MGVMSGVHIVSNRGFFIVVTTIIGVGAKKCTLVRRQDFGRRATIGKLLLAAGNPGFSLSPNNKGKR